VAYSAKLESSKLSRGELATTASATSDPGLPDSSDPVSSDIYLILLLVKVISYVTSLSLRTFDRFYLLWKKLLSGHLAGSP